jgi:glycosyltransferase involved in cell wall biosynthesis
MQFSIITPSFRGGQWLKLCIASVADQGVELEHIVQDACSDDETRNWLPQDSRVKAFIEKDQGMYDAVNRGMRRASGEILAYINCDEQYLPGALRHVKEFFQQHPNIDVAFGDTVVVSVKGEYLCHRKAIIPSRYHTWVGGGLATYTCSTFFRRRIIESDGLFFDAKLRDLGDAEWVMRLIDKKVHMAVLPEFMAAFTVTGANMNLMPNAEREKAELFASAPAWARKLRLGIKAQNRARLLLTRGWRQQPFSYEIFTKNSPTSRQLFQALRPTIKWPAEHRLSAPVPSA